MLDDFRGSGIRGMARGYYAWFCPPPLLPELMKSCVVLLLAGINPE